MSFGEKIRRFLASRRRHKLWQRIVGGLGIVVVFVTTYMLILPAITMEKPTYCGIEEHSHTQECYLSCSEGESAPPEYSCGGLENYIHKHNEDCYYNGELVCPLEERENHVHTQECYTEEQRLICGMEESEGHTHDESCYNIIDELVCGMDEGEEHTHDDSCYEHIEELICGQEESEGHTHDDSCYETVRVYNCTAASAHIHDADCYDADGNLICNLEEAEEHIHSEACMTRHENEEHKHTDECYGDTPLCGMTEHKHTDACYENPDKETSGGGGSSADDKTEETTDNHKDENNDHMGYDEPVIIDDVISGAMAGPQFLDLNADGDTPNGAPDKFDSGNVKVYLSTGADEWSSDPFMPNATDYAGDPKYEGYHLVADIINVKSDGKISSPTSSQEAGVKTALGIDPTNTNFYNTEGFLVGNIYYAKEGSDNLPIPQGAKVDVYLNVQGAAGERYLQVVARGTSDDNYKMLTSDIDTLTGELDSEWYDMIKHFYFVTDTETDADNNEYFFVSTKVFCGYVDSINYNKEGGGAIIDGTPNLLDDSTAENGYDDSLNNRIIRTFDNIQYNLTFGLSNRGISSPTAENTERLKVKFSQKKDISQAVFNMSDMSWLQNWRIDYYNSDELDKDGNPTGELLAYETAEGKFRQPNSKYDYQKFDSESINQENNQGQYTAHKMDLQWWDDSDKVGENGFIKTDYNEIIRVHQKTASSTDSSYDSGIRYQVLTGYTKISLPGTQNRTVGIRVLASANGDEIAPVFDAYFEGNPLNLNNEVLNSSGVNMIDVFQKPTKKVVALDTASWGPNSVAAGGRDAEGHDIEEVKDNGKVKVTAEPRYKFNIQSNDNLSYRGYFNLTTGEEDTTGDEDTNIYGRMVGYGVTLTLVNDSDNPETKKNKGIMGIELPTGDVTLNFNVESAGTGKFSTLSLEPSQPIMRLNSAVEGTFFSEITLDDGAGILSILSSNNEEDTDIPETESVDYADENTDNVDEYEYDSDNNYIENTDENSGDTAPIDEESNAFTLSDDDNSYFDALVSDDTEYFAGNVNSINDTVEMALFDEEFYDLMAAITNTYGTFSQSSDGDKTTYMWDYSKFESSADITMNSSENSSVDGILYGSGSPKISNSNKNLGLNGASIKIPILATASSADLTVTTNSGSSWTSRTIKAADRAAQDLTTSEHKFDSLSGTELTTVDGDTDYKYIILTGSDNVKVSKIEVTFTASGSGTPDPDEGKDGTHTAVDEAAGTESWDFKTNMPSTDKTVGAGTKLNSGVTVGDAGATLTSSGIKLAEGGTLSFPAQIIDGKPKATITVTPSDNISVDSGAKKQSDGTWVIDDVSTLPAAIAATTGENITITAIAATTITGISVTYSAAETPPVSEGNIVKAYVFSAKPGTEAGNNVNPDITEVDNESLINIYRIGDSDFGPFELPSSFSGRNDGTYSCNIDGLGTIKFNCYITDDKGKTFTITVPNDGSTSAKLYVIADGNGSSKASADYILTDTSADNIVYTPTQSINTTSKTFTEVIFNDLTPEHVYTLCNSTQTSHLCSLILVTSKDPLGDMTNWPGAVKEGTHTAPAGNNNTEEWGFDSEMPASDVNLTTGQEFNNGIKYLGDGGKLTSAGLVVANGESIEIPVDTDTYTGGKLTVEKTGGDIATVSINDDTGYKFTSRDITDNSVTITANGETTITGINIAYDKPKEGSYGNYSEGSKTWSFVTDTPSNAGKAWLKNAMEIDGGITFNTSKDDALCESYFGATSLHLADGDELIVPLPENINETQPHTYTIGTGTESKEITADELEAHHFKITGEQEISTISLTYTLTAPETGIIDANVLIVNTDATISDNTNDIPITQQKIASASGTFSFRDSENRTFNPGSSSATPPNLTITDLATFGFTRVSKDFKDCSVVFTVPATTGAHSTKLYAYTTNNAQLKLYDITDQKVYNKSFSNNSSDYTTAEFTGLVPGHKYQLKTGSNNTKLAALVLVNYADALVRGNWGSTTIDDPGEALPAVGANIAGAYIHLGPADTDNNVSCTITNSTISGLTKVTKSKSGQSGNIFKVMRMNNGTLEDKTYENYKSGAVGTSKQTYEIKDLTATITLKERGTLAVGSYIEFKVPEDAEAVHSTLHIVGQTNDADTFSDVSVQNIDDNLEYQEIHTFNNTGLDSFVVEDLKPGKTYRINIARGGFHFGAVALVSYKTAYEGLDPWYDPNKEVTPEEALVYAFLPYPEASAKSGYSLSPSTRAIHTQYEPTVTEEGNKALDIFSYFATSDGTAIHTVTKGKFTGTIDGYGTVTSTKETGKSNSPITISVPNKNPDVKSAKLYVIAGSSSTDKGEDRIITLKNQENNIQSYKITGDIPAIQRVMEFTDLTPGETYTLTPSAADGAGDSNVRYVAIVLVFSTTAEPYDTKWNSAGTPATESKPEAEPTPSANTDLKHIPFLWDYDPNYQPDDYGTWHRNLDWDKDGWRTNSARNAAPYNYGWERRNAGNDIEEKANFSYPETEVNAVYGTEEYEVHWGGDWFVNEKYKLANVTAFDNMKKANGNCSVKGVNSYPVTVNGYEFDFENNSNMWFPTNYGGHSMGSKDFSNNGFGKYKLAYSVGYFETIVPFDTDSNEEVTVRGSVREFKANSLGGTTVFQDSKGNIISDHSNYDVDHDEDRANKVDGDQNGNMNALRKYVNFMAKGATNINDKDITDATRNDPSMRDATNNIIGQFLGDSCSTKNQDWDASASVGDRIDGWSGLQLGAPSDYHIGAFNFMQKYDSEVLDLDIIELQGLETDFETEAAGKTWASDSTISTRADKYEYLLLGRTWDDIYKDAGPEGLDIKPEVNLLWGVCKAKPTDGFNSTKSGDTQKSADETAFDWYDTYTAAIASNDNKGKVSAVMAEVRNVHIVNGMYFGFRIPLVVSEKATVGNVYSTTNILEGWTYVEAAGDNQPMKEFTWQNQGSKPTGKKGMSEKDNFNNCYDNTDDAPTSNNFYKGGRSSSASYTYASGKTANYKRQRNSDCGFVVTDYAGYLDSPDGKADPGNIGQHNRWWQRQGSSYPSEDSKGDVDTAWSYGMGLLITDYKSQVEIDVYNDDNIVGGIPYYNKADSESAVYRIHNIKTFTNRINNSSYGETGKESYKNNAAPASLDLRVDLTKLENAADSTHGGVYVSFDEEACPVVKFVTGTDENGKPTYSETSYKLIPVKTGDSGGWQNVIIPDDALAYQKKTGSYSYDIRAIFDGGTDESTFKQNRTIKFEYKNVPHMVDLGEILLTTDISVAAEPNTLVTAKATITGTNDKGDVRNYAAYSKNMDTTQIGISATSGAANRKYVDVTNAPADGADYKKEFETPNAENLVNPELGQEIVYTLAFSNVASDTAKENVYFYDILDNVMDKVNKGHLDVKAVKVFSSAADKRDVDQQFPAYEVFFTDETDKAKIADTWGNKDSTGAIEVPSTDNGSNTIKYNHHNTGGGDKDSSIIQLKETDHNHTAVYFKINGTAESPAVGAGRMLYIQLICEPVAKNAEDVQTKNAQSSILASDFSNTAVFIVPSADAGSDTITYNISETDTARFAPVGRSISGVVWEDGDGNGIRLRTDATIEDAKVALFRYDGSKYEKVEEDMLGNPLGNSTEAGVYVTDKDGTYSFNNLPEGKYVVAFDYDKGLPQVSTHQPAGTSATNEMHRDDNTNDAVNVPTSSTDFTGYRFITKYNYTLTSDDTGDISPIPLDSAENIAANYSNNYQNETNWDIGFAIAGDPLPETGGVGTEGIKYAGLAIACGAALMLMWDYSKRSKYGKH